MCPLINPPQVALNLARSGFAADPPGNFAPFFISYFICSWNYQFVVLLVVLSFDGRVMEM